MSPTSSYQHQTVATIFQSPQSVILNILQRRSSGGNLARAEYTSHHILTINLAISATPMPSPLLELPFELRRAIWVYALTSETNTLRYNPGTRRFNVSQIGAGLLVTCRSISAETLYMPLRLNKLVFNVGTKDVDLWVLLAKLERLEQAAQYSLRLRLKIQKLEEKP
ncbi:hypothetical protein M3J09_012949 [Ascochyta lentis]